MTLCCMHSVTLNSKLTVMHVMQCNPHTMTLCNRHTITMCCKQSVMLHRNAASLFYLKFMK